MQGGGVSAPAGSLIVSCSSPTQVCNTHFYTDLYRNAVITAIARAAACRRLQASFPVFRGSEAPRPQAAKKIKNVTTPAPELMMT